LQKLNYLGRNSVSGHVCRDDVGSESNPTIRPRASASHEKISADAMF